MRLDRYARVADFLAAAGDFLAAREAEHNLILGISSSLVESADRYDGQPYEAVVSDGDRVVLAALRTPPYNLILSEVDDPAALAVLADDLAGSGLPGVVGPPKAALEFAERWVRSEGGSSAVVINERIYRLSAVRPPRPAPGSWRAAEPRDRALLAGWLIDFGIEALNDADAERVQLGLDEWEAGSGRRYWLWEVNGAPVTLVGAGGDTPHGIRIGPVYTPPPHRGRGYASNLTAAVSQALLTEGRTFCFLYTNLANETANRIYQAIGYEPVTDAIMIRFDA
ncbi:MAG TPA: GNAT family N-acetyltransferase [Candidatus Limnocylindria bacterium]